MYQYFKIKSFKGALLVLVTLAFLIEMVYYVKQMRQSHREEEEVLHILANIGASPSDFWVTNHARLTPESILKLQENTCKVPILNPFTTEMMDFFQPTNLSCGHRRREKFYFKSQVEEMIDPLTKTVSSQPMILIYREIPPELRCCFEQLHFEKTYEYKPDNTLPEECTFITQNKTVVPSDSEYLIIKCWDTTPKEGRSKRNISNAQIRKYLPSHFELLFYVPQPSRELLHEKRKKMSTENNLKGDDKPLNVIIIGLDQVSRANLIRLMGKTFNYLRTELDAIDLQGFNKMGDATLNNTLALLTGHDFGSILRKKWFSEEDPFYDDCPWIWKNFSEKGYLTSFADDYISVFNYRFNGFKQQPTDYYMEPFLKWYHNTEMIRWLKFGTYNCIGNELALDLLQDHVRKIAASLKSHPYFQFTWLSRIHERPGYPALADQSTLETLTYFRSTGVLNKSLVILLSDHGWRAGPIMRSAQARLENRLSFAFLMLPQWFREKYSVAYKNLQENQYRLTSLYDVHSTLEDMLNPSEQLSNEMVVKREILPSGDNKGVSLFLPISKERSCADAGIDEEWCACTPYQPFALDSPMTIQLANYAVATLNSWLAPFPACQRYVLYRIISAEVKVKTSKEDAFSAEPVFDMRESQQFRIAFNVMPAEKGAHFEVTIFTDPDYWQLGGLHRISMSTEVFRLNYYNSAMCMPLYSLKKICTCRGLFFTA